MKKRFTRLMAAAIALSMVAPPGVFAAIDDATLRTHVSAKNGGKLSLAEIPVPEPPNLAQFVVNKQAAMILGKALFWDMQTGGDGQTACASCHYHAGADNRTKNQVSPGILGGDQNFGTVNGNVTGPNYTLTTNDFPFSKDLNDVVSSQGVFLRSFSPAVFNPADTCTPHSDSTFNVSDINTRRVEPRNTPTCINAVFNHRNFWDGRANDSFNGVNPAGVRDATAMVAVMNGAGVSMMRLIETDGSGNPVTNAFGVPKPLLLNASLASQAVGPALSIFEMSCGADPARNFPELGRKLLRLRPLAGQKVAADDSVLGPVRYVTGKGLNTTYARLISQAFDRKFWGARVRIDGYSQMEYNFTLFWGLAIQIYEASLVSGDTAYDRWAAGNNAALTEQEKLGLAVFSGFNPGGSAPAIKDGKCISCHVGPEFTNATVRMRACQEEGGDQESVERMIMGNGAPALYDGGFYNIAVRQTNEDIGVGNDTLAYSQQVASGKVVDYFCVNQAAFEVPGPIVRGERIAVMGAHKTPTIRNVELTAPFMRSGGHLTLEQVVEFYDSGAGKNGAFPGFAVENEADLDADIVPLGLSAAEEAGLVAFMKALTDERVRYEKAPFDHPQLFIPNGHPGDQIVISATNGIEAVDTFVEVPAVGAAGRSVPPANFLEVTPQQF
ncbi:MAG: cytochrome-c peroxidase [Desulfobulbaceae bacterium]